MSAPAPVGGDLLEHLLLELEQALGAAEEAQAGLGRLDPAAGAVEQLRAEPLLERPHLERDGRLRDAEPFRRLREAAPLDDRAERGQLSRIHKRILSCGAGRHHIAMRSLDRHDELAARAVLPAADRAARGARPRRARLGAGLRPDARAPRRGRDRRTTSSGRRTEVPGGPGRSARWARGCGRCARGPGSASTSPSPTPRTSCRSRPDRWACRRRTRTTTSSPGRSTRSAPAPRPGSSCPTSIPQERLDRLGATAAKVRRYPGLKEEYYLSGLVPDADRARPARARPLPGARGRADAARGLALPPSRQPALHRRARAARQRRRRPGGRPPANPRAARRRSAERACRRSSSPSTRSTRRA